MNADAANVIVRTVLQGAFEVLDAMLSVSLTTDPGEPSVVDEAELSEVLGGATVVMQASIQNELGALGLLVSRETANTIAALALESEPGEEESLTEEAIKTLQEVAEAALGGGVTALMEKAGPLLARMGEGAVLTPVSFRSESLSGEGYLIYAAALEDLVPEDVRNAGPDGEPDTEPTLSQDEVSDILSGFDPDALAEQTGGHAGGETTAESTGVVSSPENLDLVLDIRLVVTARLGQIEMPLGDVLKLGPGSILELGQVVDEPVELLINNRLIARGDVVVVDEKFGLRITEIVSRRERIESLR